MSEPKVKITDALRVPKPKKKLGLTVPPPLHLPHVDLITPEPRKTTQASMPSQTSLTRHTSDEQIVSNKQPRRDNAVQDDYNAYFETSSMPSQTSLTRHTSDETSKSQIITEASVEASAAPNRDFARVANSIIREALPGGLFVGKSKQLYDCLYSLTRGAVVPTRKARISRPKLMKLAGIGSRVTFEANIERLCKVGLLIVKHIAGEHKGNEYTVLLPEEIKTSVATMPSQTSLTRHAQKVDRLVRLETSQTRHSTSPADSTAYNGPKTFFKTNNDDENIHTHTLDGFLKEIEAVASEVGVDLVNVSEAEKAKWRELGEILAREFSEAAKRTGTISSLPAFFAEHLRRAFAKKDAHNQPRNLREKAVEKPPTQETNSKKEIKLPTGKSQFKFEERRRYALNQQPPLGNGWLVESASGKYDEVIGEWLKAQSDRPTEKPIDFRSCPDCHGTNMYYPEGFEKGAAKCRHERLTKLLEK